MNKILILSSILLGGLVTGCQSTGKSGSAPSTASSMMAGIDTAQLVSAFKNADAETTRLVQDTVAAVGKKDWSGAIGTLQKIQKIPGLTASQSDAVKGLLSTLSTKAK